MRAASSPNRHLFLAPLLVESMAIRAGAPRAEVRRTGMGPRRAKRAAESGVVDGTRPIVIGGFCGALDPTLKPGDIVLADEVRGPDGTTTCDEVTVVAGLLERGGLRVRVGPIASSERLVRGRERAELHATGAVAVDMESAWLASAVRTRPLVVLRVVLDTEGRELHRPLRTLTGFGVAYRALRRAANLLEDWASALAFQEGRPGSPHASFDGERAKVSGRTVATETMECMLPPEVNPRSG